MQNSATHKLSDASENPLGSAAPQDEALESPKASKPMEPAEPILEEPASSSLTVDRSEAGLAGVGSALSFRNVLKLALFSPLKPLAASAL